MKKSVKKILLTGGGTAGHVTPSLALLPKLKEAGFDIHYVGTKRGMERGLVAAANLPYHCIAAGKLRRYFDLKNFTDVFKIAFGFLQSLIIIIKLRPSVVFSKGGFVSCPVVWAAWLMRVRVVIHESDITPGLANKLSIPFARKVCFSFPETEKYLPQKKRVATGLPVREELLRGDAEYGKKLCGFEDGKPVVLVIGGSLGAKAVNEAVRGALSILLDKYNVCHICGAGGVAPGGRKGYCQFEYVGNDLPHIFAMANVVISRAGATSLFELLALKKPMLLIPLGTAASRGDQLLNARSFEERGYCKVLLQDDVTVDTLVANVCEVYENRNVYIEKMSEADNSGAIDRVVGVLVGK